MRILNVVHQYLPEFVGGTELYTQALSHALVARGHDVAIFTRTEQGAPYPGWTSEDGVGIFRAYDEPASAINRLLNTFRNPGLHSQFAAALAGFQPDLVFVQHMMGLPIQMLDMLRAAHIPYVVTLLDYWWVCANANLLHNWDEKPCAGPRAFLNCTRCGVARLGNPFAWAGAPAIHRLLAQRARLLNQALAGAHLLVTPSDFVTEWHRSQGAPAPIRTVRWGIMPPARGVPSHRPAKAGDPLRLIYVGGLAPNKGIHVVLQALRDVKGDWTLQIVGDTEKHRAHVAHLRRLAPPQVTFAGARDRPAVWQALAAADVALVPSLWHETFCLAAHEAVAARAVPFVSNMGALREVVTDGVTGRLLPPGDVAAWRAALQAAIENRTGLEQMRAALPAARRFDEHVTELLSLLKGAEIASRIRIAKLPPGAAP